MSVCQGSVRAGAKVLAQNVPTTGGLGVNLLLTDPTDFNAAIQQALRLFAQDRPNVRVVDATLAAGGFRIILRGEDAVSDFAGADAWSAYSLPRNVWYPYVASRQGQDPVDQNNYRIVQDPGGKTVLEFLVDTLQAGQVMRVEFSRPHMLTEAPDVVADPTEAAEAELAGAGEGVVDNGAHSYVFTWVTANGETLPSPAGSVTVANKDEDGQVNVTVPESDDYGVTGAKIYRTVADDDESYLLVGSLPVNGGVFVDNVADADLGAAVPDANTAGGTNTVDPDDEATVTMAAAAMILQMAAVKAAQNTGNTNLPNDVVDRRSQSDVFRSRAKELMDLYKSMVGRVLDGEGAGHSAFGDLDTYFSDRRGFLWHGGR